MLEFFSDIRICQIVPFDRRFEEFPVFKSRSLLLRMVVIEQGLHDRSSSFA